MMSASCYSLTFQVGDFYEAIGFDACILVEYAGLNPFGGLRSDSIPKAGCPVVVLVSFSVYIYIFNFSVEIIDSLRQVTPRIWRPLVFGPQERKG